MTNPTQRVTDAYAEVAKAKESEGSLLLIPALPTKEQSAAILEAIEAGAKPTELIYAILWGVESVENGLPKDF